jgi:hypothetical protein
MSGQTFVATVAGEMDEVLWAEFEDAQIIAAHGVTQVRFSSPDAAALHGVLHRIEALGLQLLELRPTSQGAC